MGRTWIIGARIMNCGLQSPRWSPIILTSCYLCSCVVLLILNRANLCNQQDTEGMMVWLEKLGHRTVQLPSCFLLDHSPCQAALWRCPFCKELKLSTNHQPWSNSHLSESSWKLLLQVPGEPSADCSPTWHFFSILRDPQARTIPFRPLLNSWPSEALWNHQCLLC